MKDGVTGFGHSGTTPNPAELGRTRTILLLSSDEHLAAELEQSLYPLHRVMLERLPRNVARRTREVHPFLILFDQSTLTEGLTESIEALRETEAIVSTVVLHDNSSGAGEIDEQLRALADVVLYKPVSCQQIVAEIQKLERQRLWPTRVDQGSNVQRTSNS